ncbi:MAG TPA: glycosyltransferase, partial [Gemmatimonadales bacterium]|nr:glycosyltransferase [Gemmatimonadales bacterium]
ARNALFAVGSVAVPTPIPNEQSMARKLWDHARSVMTGRPYTFYEYQSGTFGDRLRKTLRSRPPDLVHMDSLDLHRWLPDLPPVPIACTHHDIEPELLRRRAAQLGQPLRRYLLFQADRAEQMARAVCPQLALNVMMSAVDAQRLRELVPGAVTTVVPNGTDTEYFQPSGDRSVDGRVAFVGPTYSFPNRDAVEWLLEAIWPSVCSGSRAASLHLIGRNPPADQERYDAEPNVTALGEVADIRPALAEARCCVVPIRVGGGTRLKILDAWAMGKAVVSTSIGCEGLDAVDGENILIRDTPEALADAVLRVLSDAELRARLERNARHTAVTTYSWNAVGQTIRAAYHQLLGRPGSAPPAPRSTLPRIVARMGMIAGLILAAPACLAPEASSESQTPVEPPGQEPAGLVTFNDQPWDVMTGGGGGGGGGSRSLLSRLGSFVRRSPEQSAWNFLRRTSSRDDDIVQDEAAPRSPPNVLRIIFTSDMARDAEPSVHWIALPGVREVYTEWWMKLSPNWQFSPAGAGKITFLWTTPNGAGQVYTNLYHRGGSDLTGWLQGPPYRIGVNTEWAPYGQKIWLPNKTTTFISPGEWHRIEFYYRWGANGDGVIQWWVDGVLNGDYGTVSYPVSGSGFSQFEFAPTLQIPPLREQYMYIDHTHISIPGVK